jgi:hypothetical protein
VLLVAFTWGTHFVYFHVVACASSTFNWERRLWSDNGSSSCVEDTQQTSAGWYATKPDSVYREYMHTQPIHVARCWRPTGWLLQFVSYRWMHWSTPSIHKRVHVCVFQDNLRILYWKNAHHYLSPLKFRGLQWVCIFIKWGDNLPNSIGLDSREAIFLTLKYIERRDIHLFVDKVLG